MSTFRDSHGSVVQYDDQILRQSRRGKNQTVNGKAPI
jgi:hypothetical protein